MLIRWSQLCKYCMNLICFRISNSNSIFHLWRQIQIHFNILMTLNTNSICMFYLLFDGQVKATLLLWDHTSTLPFNYKLINDLSKFLQLTLNHFNESISFYDLFINSSSNDVLFNEKRLNVIYALRFQR